jgi:hypothetical protein
MRKNRVAKNETAPGANRGGGTTGRNGLRKNNTAPKCGKPVVTVRLVLKALAEVLWVEGNEIQQVRRNRHLLIEAYDVESGPRDPFLAAVEAPVEVFDNFGELKGEHAWDHDELERRVVKEIAATRAWKALSKKERRARIAESEARRAT